MVGDWFWLGVGPPMWYTLGMKGGTAMVELYTSRFGERALGEHPEVVKVGIARGRPKFRLGYEPEWLMLLAPPGWLLARTGLSEAEWGANYRAQLDGVGVRRIDAELGRIAARHGGKPLVLLCYEDLTKPGVWCHRRIFAAWWEERTGRPVPEWRPDATAERSAPAERAEQMPLIL